MGVEENKAIVLDAYELFNKRDIDGFLTFFAPEYVEHYTTRDASLEEVKNFLVNAASDWAEGHSTIEHIVAEGDKLAYRVRHEGTLKKTGKKVRWINTAIVRIEDGKWAEVWSTNDDLNLMQQLGVIPSMEEIQKKGQEEKTIEENKDLMNQYFSEVNAVKGDTTKYLDWHDKYIDPKTIYHQPIGDWDGDLAKQFDAASAKNIPDLNFTIEDMVVEGDKVVVRQTMRGTHTGEFMGVAPTGNKFSQMLTCIFRIADGKIAEIWWLADTLGLLQQLGALPTTEEIGK